MNERSIEPLVTNLVAQYYPVLVEGIQGNAGNQATFERLVANRDTATRRVYEFLHSYILRTQNEAPRRIEPPENRVILNNVDVRHVLIYVLFFLILSEDERLGLKESVLNRFPAGATFDAVRQELVRALVKAMVSKMRARERRFFMSYGLLVSGAGATFVRPNEGAGPVSQASVKREMEAMIATGDLLEITGLLYNENLMLEEPTALRRLIRRAQDDDPEGHVIDTVVRRNVRDAAQIERDPRADEDFRRKLANAERRQRRLRARAQEGRRETLDQVIRNSLRPGTLGTINYRYLQNRLLHDFFRIVDSLDRDGSIDREPPEDLFEEFFESLGNEEDFDADQLDSIALMRNALERHANQEIQDEELREAMSTFIRALGPTLVPTKRAHFRRLIRERLRQHDPQNRLESEEREVEPAQVPIHRTHWWSMLLAQIPFPAVADLVNAGARPAMVPQAEAPPPPQNDNPEDMANAALMAAVQAAARTGPGLFLDEEADGGAQAEEGGGVAADEDANDVPNAAEDAALIVPHAQQRNAILQHVIRILKMTERPAQMRDRLRALVTFQDAEGPGPQRVQFQGQSSLRALVLQQARSRDIQFAQRQLPDTILVAHDSLINKRKVQYDARPVATALAQLSELDMLCTTLLALLTQEQDDPHVALHESVTIADPMRAMTLINVLRALRDNALPNLKACETLLNVGLLRR